MSNFKKLYNLKIIVLSIAVIFLINIQAHGSNLPKTFLRTPLMDMDRLNDAVDRNSEVEEIPASGPDKDVKLSTHLSEPHIEKVLQDGFVFNEYLKMALYDEDFGFYSKKVDLGRDFGTFALALSPVSILYRIGSFLPICPRITLQSVPHLVNNIRFWQKASFFIATPLVIRDIVCHISPYRI